MLDADGQAIVAVCRGETERYAELVDRHQHAALRLAYSLLGNAHDAEDAAQEAFVSAYRGLRRFRLGAKFSTWLYRIVINKCRDMQRRRARGAILITVAADEEAEDGSLFDSLEDPAAGPQELAHQRDVARVLTSAIRGLPTQQRMAVVLHHLQDLPLEDAAEIMGCRTGTVKAHLFRAHQALRERARSWRISEEIA